MILISNDEATSPILFLGSDFIPGSFNPLSVQISPANVLVAVVTQGVVTSVGVSPTVVAVVAVPSVIVSIDPNTVNVEL